MRDALQVPDLRALARAPIRATNNNNTWAPTSGEQDMQDMAQGSNVAAHIAYDDLREWLALAERLGEVKTVRGATWQEDIGLAAEAILRAEHGPCVVFEDVPGCPKGFRVLLNMFAGKRRNLTFGFPDHLTKWELSDAYREAYLKDPKITPHEIVEGGPIFENIMMGEDVDVTKFPSPIWHEKDGGRYIGKHPDGVRPMPLVDIKAIYHRNDPILLGVPPMGAGPDEMARYRAVMRSAIIKQNMVNAGVPGVNQVWCHEVGGARMLHAVSITQRYPGHAVQAAHIAAQCGGSAYASKYIVVCDDDVDVTNLDHMLWAMITRTDPVESIQFIRGSWDSNADPAIPPERRKAGDMTHSVALINACKPWHSREEFAPSNTPSPEVARKAREKFGCLLNGK